ncbi:MAG: hypothetical protein Q8P20_01685 [bacterium]|nr:hypothetical protein [bacterium]
MIKEFSINISATGVAWYGAIIATVGIVLSIITYLRDRAKIKIEYRENIKIRGQQRVYDPNTEYINITVYNRGRRPVCIEKASIRVLGKDGPWIILTDSFMPFRNKILNEENPRTEFLMEQKAIDLSKAYFIQINDGVNRSYRKYFHIFPTLWRLIQVFKNLNNESK